jgi:hypothetical protein
VARNPITWYLARRKAKEEEREDIARAQREQLRAGEEEQPESMSETVEDAFSQLPPQP